ncbi:MAG: hypothetical protein GOVbin52_79 [Prokaryotic dsDNA virus sp.]|nr:MAG: hypothetical protein GOVbin52_79 [Prokaryotic dsDNA virus sp.]
MTLDDWCKQDGRGPSALCKHLGVSRSTFWRLRNGGFGISPEVAKQIQDATGGKVRAAVMLGLEKA